MRNLRPKEIKQLAWDHPKSPFTGSKTWELNAIILFVGVPESKKKKICLQCGRPRFDPWVRKISWRREWLPSPVFLRIPQTEEPGGLQSMESQRTGHDWVTNTVTHSLFHVRDLLVPEVQLPERWGTKGSPRMWSFSHNITLSNIKEFLHLPEQGLENYSPWSKSSLCLPL